MKSRVIFIFLILFFYLLTSCKYFKNYDDKQIVATIYDKILYEDDLKDLVPEQTPDDISNEIKKQYIDNWIRKEALIRNAEKNLSNERKDFSAQIESYRSSLLLYEYEQELLKQKLDTVITHKEIENYYEQNKENLILNDNIVKYRYVKAPSTIESNVNINKIKQLMMSDKSGDEGKFIELCNNPLITLHINDDNWVSFSKVINETPVFTNNISEFLKNNKFLQISDSAFTYLIKFNDYKLVHSIAPLEYEKEIIKALILNKRKMDIIEQMQKTVVEKTIKDKAFKIYKYN